MSDVRQHPGWKHALHLFDQEKITYGDTINRHWLVEAFGMQNPWLPAGKSDDRLRLEFLSELDAFKTALRDERQMLLRSRRRDGEYEVVPLNRFAAVLAEDGRRMVMKGLNFMRDYAAAAPLDRMNQEQRDDVAHVQLVQSAIRSSVPSRDKDWSRLLAAAKGRDEPHALMFRAESDDDE